MFPSPKHKIEGVRCGHQRAVVGIVGVYFHYQGAVAPMEG
jgi:hypothetical protein